MGPPSVLWVHSTGPDCVSSSDYCNIDVMYVFVDLSAYSFYWGEGHPGVRMCRSNEWMGGTSRGRGGMSIPLLLYMSLEPTILQTNIMGSTDSFLRSPCLVVNPPVITSFQLQLHTEKIIIS